MDFVNKIKNKILHYFIEKAIERQLNKVSSPDCNSETLFQSYDFLTRLADSHKDDSEIASKIYSALDVCLNSPKNNKHTYCFIHAAIKRQLNKVYSPDCNSETLCQSYDFLTSLACSHKDDSEIVSRIYDALYVCLNSPKNDKDTYFAAMFNVVSSIQNEPKFMPYVANMYERIRVDDSVFPFIEKFFENHPEQTSVVVDCVKNMVDNDVDAKDVRRSSVDMLFNICKMAEVSESDKVKALDAMCMIAARSNMDNKKSKNLKGDKKRYEYDIYYAINRVREMDLSSPEVASKAFDIIGIGLRSENKNNLTSAAHALFKIIYNYPEKAKDVFNLIKSNFDIDKYNFDSFANVISDVLREIGKADKTLAKDVSDLEKKIHPNSPRFQFNEVDGEMICKTFRYDSKNPNNFKCWQEYWDGECFKVQNFKDGKLVDEGIFKDGKCCKLRQFKDGKLVDESNWKDGELDGVSVSYDDNGAISNVSVYDKGKETHSAFVVDSKINELSKGVFVQMPEVGIMECLYPDGTHISVNTKKGTICMSEKMVNLINFQV